MKLGVCCQNPVDTTTTLAAEESGAAAGGSGSQTVYYESPVDHGEGSRLDMFWTLAGLGLRSNLMMTVSRQLFNVSCLSHRDPLYHGDAPTRA